MDPKDQEATVGGDQEPKPQATETSPDIVIPDGGLEAWCTIAGAYVDLVVSMFPKLTGRSDGSCSFVHSGMA